MPKLTETFDRKGRPTKQGTAKRRDNELIFLVLFVGKKPNTWYFHKDVCGQTRRVLIDRHPVTLAGAARQTALGYAQE